MVFDKILSAITIRLRISIFIILTGFSCSALAIIIAFTIYSVYFINLIIA